MGEEAQLLVQDVDLLAGESEIVLIAEFGHRIGDRIVEAAIERPELVDVDLHAAFERQVGDRLAQVAVVVDDRIDAETVSQQFLAVQRRTFADFRQSRLAAAGGAGHLAAARGLGRLFDLQGLDELLQEHGDSVFQLHLRHARRRAPGNLDPASGDQLGAVRCEELMHHSGTIRGPCSVCCGDGRPADGRNRPPASDRPAYRQTARCRRACHPPRSIRYVL